MKKYLESLWPDLSIDSVQGGREIYQEFIIKSVLLIMWGVIAFFTPIVLFIMFFQGKGEPFPIIDFLIVLMPNLFSPIAVYFANKGYWQVFGHFVPLIFIIVGGYGVWFYGILTTFMLFFALVVVLAGMFHRFKIQLLVIVGVLTEIIALNWYRGYSWEESLPSIVLLCALLFAIGLLQNLSGQILWKIVDHNIGLTNELRQENLLRQAREVEIEQMNMSLDAEVRLRTAQLAVKHKELADLSYSLAHDLRAPLRAVVGFSQIIQQENKELLDDHTQDLLQRSIEAGHRMDNLIESILALSQVGQSQLNYEIFNIAEMVQKAFEEIIIASGTKDAELVCTACPELKADPELTWILIRNLMSNAKKFGRPEEKLEIEFGCKAQETERIVYYFQDNGIGFSMDYAEKIFEPFHRVVEDDSVEGIGIGLSIARRVVERHGGAIWAEAEPGQGTVIYFSFFQSQKPLVPGK